MSDPVSTRRPRVTLEPAALQQLIDTLRTDGFRVIGPVLGNGSIVYDDLTSTSQLPQGRTDRQQPGLYRLGTREDEAWFGYAVGPHSLKRFLYPPVTRLWKAERKGSGLTLVPEGDEAPPTAFVGVRACDVAAMLVQDRVLLQGPYIDPAYRQRRQAAFIVAVNCGSPGGTCFCASMGTGPAVKTGHDIALTEVLADGAHAFVAEAGSDRGAALLGRLATRPVTDGEAACAAAAISDAARHMGRTVAAEGVPERLAANVEDPRWDLVARRCLTCANCTLVCPTCFCSTVEDETDLSGAHATRVRKWDSCFTLDFSYIHGGSVRPSPYARYRQWLTHKFGTWVEQFGTSGCVGCGRCITWCPVGIDVTEEVRAMGGQAPSDLPVASA